MIPGQLVFRSKIYFWVAKERLNWPGGELSCDQIERMVPVPDSNREYQDWKQADGGHDPLGDQNAVLKVTVCPPFSLFFSPHSNTSLLLSKLS